MEFTSGKTKRILLREISNDEYGLKKIPSGRLETIVDIGANIGIVSSLARLCHPESTIYSFEPNPDVFNILSKNVDGLNINIHQEAIGDGSFVSMKKGRSNLSNSFVATDDQKESIKTLRLHELINKHNISINKKTLLKIDCEGGEWSMCNSKDRKILLEAGIICFEIHGDEKNRVVDFYNWLLSNRKMIRRFGMNLYTGRLGHALLWNKNEFGDIFW